MSAAVDITRIDDPDVTVVLTDHARERVAQRVPFAKGGAHQTVAFAWRCGTRHGATTGALRSWLDRKLLAGDERSEGGVRRVRVYRGFAWVFSRQVGAAVLVTVLRLPDFGRRKSPRRGR